MNEGSLPVHAPWRPFDKVTHPLVGPYSPLRVAPHFCQCRISCALIRFLPFPLPGTMTPQFLVLTFAANG